MRTLFGACAVLMVSACASDIDGDWTRASQQHQGLTSAETVDVEAGHAQSFTVTLSGDAHLTPQNDCLVLNAETAQAHSALLGDLQWNDLEVINFCSVAPGISVVSQFTLTAANGDKLYGTFETSGTFDGSGTLSIGGIFRFTGGSGAYVGVKGAGRIYATGAPPDPSGVGAVTGGLQGLIVLPSTARNNP